MWLNSIAVLVVGIIYLLIFKQESVISAEHRYEIYIYIYIYQTEDFVKLSHVIYVPSISPYGRPPA